jgi:ATP-dependent helicase/nuclease subunit A
MAMTCRWPHALKSPLFAASDADLLSLAGTAEEHGSWWQALLRDDGPALGRARALLARWAKAALRLSPHDLLDLIVTEGDVSARFAAAVPPARRAVARQAVQALLAQALDIDGGRYTTPYGFVRALRQLTIKATPATEPDAVQLLTVHGAKGLEARIVFVMDADPEPQKPDTATLLIDWPVESAAPTCCAFIYAESRCPAALAGALEREQAAREREELNGLYVALTRAKQSLVFSRVEPFHQRDRASWWRRVEGLLEPWVPGNAMPALNAEMNIRLRSLPELAGAR